MISMNSNLPCRICVNERLFPETLLFQTILSQVHRSIPVWMERTLGPNLIIIQSGSFLHQTGARLVFALSHNIIALICHVSFCQQKRPQQVLKMCRKENICQANSFKYIKEIDQQFVDGQISFSIGNISQAWQLLNWFLSCLFSFLAQNVVSLRIF